MQVWVTFTAQLRQRPLGLCLHSIRAHNGIQQLNSSPIPLQLSILLLEKNCTQFSGQSSSNLFHSWRNAFYPKTPLCHPGSEGSIACRLPLVLHTWVGTMKHKHSKLDSGDRDAQGRGWEIAATMFWLFILDSCYFLSRCKKTFCHRQIILGKKCVPSHSVRK